MTKTEQVRVATWRSKVLQHAAAIDNVARTCRRFGMSRKTFYKWRQRFVEHGDAGLCDRPRTPRRVPRATADDVIGKIVYLRQHYHFGAGRIADYLKRFHQVTVARSTVHRILTRRGLARLPANQKHRAHSKRWRRYEKPQPGHRLQVDVKFLERIPGTRRRFYQFTAIDDCTRIRVLKVFDACTQRTAIQFIDDVLRCLPFRVHVVQTDYGPEFQSQFHWHLEQRDIRHVYIRPRTPHLNGKVERSHRVDDQEFYQLLDQDGISDNITLFNNKLREWEDYSITIGRTAPWADKRRTNACWQRRGRRCHPGPETLQLPMSQDGQWRGQHTLDKLPKSRLSTEPIAFRLPMRVELHRAIEQELEDLPRLWDGRRRSPRHLATRPTLRLCARCR
jgi:transposase